MDAITQFIASLAFPPATMLSLFINEWQLFGLLVLCAFLFVHMALRDARRSAFAIFTVLLCLLCAITIKEFAKEPRSCAELSSKAPCPPDYSFPSLHAAVAFALALSLLGTSLFLPALFLALLISLSRVYLGVHTLPDVSASLAFSILAYALSISLWHIFSIKKSADTVFL